MTIFANYGEVSGHRQTDLIQSLEMKSATL
jgi:hypothetical protein